MKRTLFLIPLETIERQQKVVMFLTGLIIGLLVLPSLVRADNFVINGYTPLEVPAEGGAVASGALLLTGYTEIGKRSTAEDYEEENTDDDYTYRNYHLKFGQKVSDRLSYDIGSFIQVYL